MTSLGKYNIKGELGQGSMGTIYRAQDGMLDREVALKVMSNVAIGDAELKERFYREARAGARLHHPNIATVYDFGEENGVAYIAMELLEGADLRRILSEQRALSLERKLEIMAGVCEGLHHAHSRGIVHRDVKPSNIFVPDEGQARVLDFGVARILASSLTVVGRVLGTPQYMAPEQIRGKPCDGRADLFAAAIVAFELLSGRYPFPSSSRQGYPALRIVESPADSLLAAAPDLPAELEAVVARGLEKDPARRYATGREFAAALRGVPIRLAAAITVSSAGPAAQSLPGLPANTEYRMSEVLTNLKRFEDAVEVDDIAAIRQAIAAMEQAGHGDDRFGFAIESCRSRFIEIEKRFGASAPHGPIAAPEPPASMPLPAIETPVSTSHAELADATVLFERHAVVPPDPARAELPPPAVAPAPTPAPIVPRSRRGFWIGAAVAAAVLTVAGGGSLLSQRSRSAAAKAVPPAFEPAATAEVSAGSAGIFERPEETARLVATVRKGGRISVERPPDFQEQQWTAVRHEGARAYVRTALLGNWSSSDPVVDGRLRALFRAEPPPPGPAPPASEAKPVPAATPVPAARPETLDAVAELKKAEWLWKEGQYKQALAALDQMASARPDSPAAAALRARVQKAMELEGN